MCGRYVLRRLDAFRRNVTFVQPEFEEFSEIRILPRFNIAPSQFAPVIHLNDEGKPIEQMMKWGFVPRWMKGKPKIAPINAKSETAASSGMFREAMDRHRCLIPADGFYEPKGPKTLKSRPWHFFQLHEAKPFAFGGLWERWIPEPDVEPVETFTLLTTAPNAVVKRCHDRMPLILHQQDYERWLDRGINADGIADLLAAYPAEDMESWPVGDGVKRAENEGDRLIKPMDEQQDSLFHES
jgi:putative SOS response-associated peptidase YedK